MEMARNKSARISKCLIDGEADADAETVIYVSNIYLLPLTAVVVRYTLESPVETNLCSNVFFFT